MTSNRVLRCFVTGLFVGLLLIPPLPAQAQFGVVFDPRAYALQIQKRIEEAKRWVETARHYQEIYANAAEQLTNLRGVLRTVDKQLFKNHQAALLANDIGKILTDSQKLRRRLEGMIRYQIQSLKSIDDRLEQGIFDPDADMRDLQNYLLYTMGRDARQAVDQMMRTARADAQLAAWQDQRAKLQKETSTISRALDNNRALLDVEQNNLPDDQRNIQHLNEMIIQQEKQIADLQNKVKELTEKINQRIKDHGLRLQDMENFAQEVTTTNQMWRELQKTKVELQQTMDSLILYSPPPATE
jgi:chromosome segregation ATPase